MNEAQNFMELDHSGQRHQGQPGQGKRYLSLQPSTLHPGLKGENVHTGYLSG